MPICISQFQFSVKKHMSSLTFFLFPVNYLFRFWIEHSVLFQTTHVILCIFLFVLCTFLPKNREWCYSNRWNVFFSNFLIINSFSSFLLSLFPFWMNNFANWVRQFHKQEITNWDQKRIVHRSTSISKAVPGTHLAILSITSAKLIRWLSAKYEPKYSLSLYPFVRFLLILLSWCTVYATLIRYPLAIAMFSGKHPRPARQRVRFAVCVTWPSMLFRHTKDVA